MKLYGIILMLFVFSFAACQSQKSGRGLDTSEVAEFEVSGLCGMCKERIEAAVRKGGGVNDANWNKETSMLKVTYDISLLKEMDLHKRIAAAGHDTEKVKAADKVYENLPGCCQHRDKDKEKH
ncbi:MAG: cation transporter [Bernardetiaceae bacterium]|nr:cation transporter [Bernardetiaceae bacterium]